MLYNLKQLAGFPIPQAKSDNVKLNLLVFFALAAVCMATGTKARAIAFSPDAAAAIEEAAEEEAPQDSGTADADTTAAYPEKMSANSGVEKAVNLPLKIVYLPFLLVFKTAEGALYLYEKSPPILKPLRVLIAADGSRGVYPLFEARYGLGAMFFVKYWPDDTSRFDVSTMWGLRGRNRQRLRHRRIGVFNDYMLLGYELRWWNLPDERFFGVGPNTPESAEAQFGWKMGLAQATLGKSFKERLQIDVIGAFEHNIIADGNNPDGTPVVSDEYPNLPGLGEELTLVRFGFGLDWDGRNRKLRPSKGVEVMFRGGWIQDANDTDFGLSIIAADFDAYFELYRGRVIKLRLGGEFTDPLPGREIPFYWLPQLGRLETIRGLTRGRFRDRDMVLGSMEYRWPISTLGDALLFVDAGQVQQNIFNDFRIDDIVWTFGGGYRFWLPDGRTGVRAEIGVSKERLRFHFVVIN